MCKLTLSELEQVKGRIPFRKLVIDGYCPFNDFYKRILHEGNLDNQLIGLINNMTQVANLRRLPAERFRDITPIKDRVKEFEVKKGDFRVYLVKEQGHIVILGGKKNSQLEDIRHFRSLKRRYLQSKNNENYDPR